MRSLILHIGAHKTGTTSIQVFLKNRNKKLQDAGWDFITHGECLNWSPLVFTGSTVCINKQILGTLETELRKSPNNCIVSCEDLFFLSDLKDILGLKQCLSNIFVDIQIIVYLRRQLEAALSQKIQAAKTNPSDAIFGHEFNPLPKITPHVRDYLDYHKKLSVWSQTFGSRSLVARWYQPDLLVNGDAITDFLASTKLLLKPRKILANKSPGPQTAFFLHTLRANGFPLTFSYRLEAGDWIKTDYGKAWLPSRSKAKIFQSEFSESNEQLAELIGTPVPFSSDFSRYPEASQALSLNARFAQQNLHLVKRYLQRYYSPRILALLNETITRLGLLREDEMCASLKKCLFDLTLIDNNRNIESITLPKFEKRNGDRNGLLRTEFYDVIRNAQNAQLLLRKARLLKTAAQKLEKSDPTLSYHLMQTYFVYCPGDVAARETISAQEAALRKTWNGSFSILRYKAEHFARRIPVLFRRKRQALEKRIRSPLPGVRL